MRGSVAVLLGGAKKTFAAWLGAERGQLFNWIPVGLALGIALYFSLNVEPGPWVGMAAVAVSALLFLLGRRWLVPRLVILSCLMISLGFASAQWRTARVAAPQLEWQTLARHVDATVEQVLKTPDKPLKLVLLDPVIAGLEPARTPHRLSLTIRTGTGDLSPGDRVGLSAVMMPPGVPAMPGTFDFARQSYFQGIGAVGFAVSPVLRSSVAPRSGPAWMEGFNLRVEKLRQEITRKFIDGIPGASGGMAAALTTGIRDGIPADVVVAMRNSGLAHLLAIAGMHMGMVTGIVFFFLRAVLAAFPSVALAYPIKKWAALAAAVVAIGYLLISGASLPTIRAFAMGGLVFMAVILDRNPISMRLLALAAIIIFALKPESLLNVSFQMSFAAVGALIATYEWLSGPIGRWTREHPGIITKIILYPLFITITSIAATIATAPVSIYHFNQIAVYAVLGNILAIPLVGFWIFPWAIIAFVLMPFHLEGLAMAPLGLGIDLLIEIAREVSALPDAVMNFPAFPLPALGVIAFGGAWLCLWRSPLRLMGLAMIAGGVMMALSVRGPDILIDGQGKLMAVKGQGGQYIVSNLRSDKYARDFWLRNNNQTLVEKWPIPAKARKRKRAAAAAPEPVVVSHDPSLTCDDEKCVYAPWHGTDPARRPRIIMHFGKGDPVEDCAGATLLVSTAAVQGPCRDPALIIDRFNSFYYGSHAIWISRTADARWKIRMASAADDRGMRPWSNTPAPPAWLAARAARREVIW